MPKITLNGTEVEFEAGQTVIELAKSQGLDIPHYCWHPALSVAASCRMCMVEVHGPGPKRIVTSCNTACVDGMMVVTESPQIARARAGNLEALLLNHPLDCPICDKAGECWLQDYTYEYGAAAGRNEFPRRKAQKRVHISEHVLLDQERCILCTRCVRFLDDFCKRPELVVTGRGSHSVIDIFPGHPVSSPYQGNLADICPVGALTLKSFRFQNRVWYLKGTDSVCPSCSRGCSVTLDVRDNDLNRVRPRTNLQVNGYFICDEGRFGLLKRYRPEGRLEKVLARGKRMDLATAADAIASKLQVLFGSNQKLLVAASPDCTNEELLLADLVFRGSASEGLVNLVYALPDKGEDDGILRTGEAAANRAGLEALGYAGLDPDQLNARAGECAGLVLLGDGRGMPKKRPPLSIALTILETTAAEADFALPAFTVAEKDGTFTNCGGITQRVRRALAPPPSVPGEFAALLRIGSALGVTDLPATPAAAFLSLGKRFGAAGLTLAALPKDGIQLTDMARRGS
ncbi:MAG: 2Fe-2S iron-sulfur cluster-binding protein [Planctomycetota bacterium]